MVAAHKKSDYESMYQSQRPQHCIEKSPCAVSEKWQRKCLGQECFLSWMESIRSTRYVPTRSRHCWPHQHSIWALQIPKDALWHKFRQWSISALHGTTVCGLPLLSHRRWHHHRRPRSGWTWPENLIELFIDPHQLSHPQTSAVLPVVKLQIALTFLDINMHLYSIQHFCHL